MAVLIRAAGALLLAACALAMAADPLRHGRLLFEAARGMDTVTATMGTPVQPVPAHEFPCARCHGDAGQGDSEGGIEAPPLRGEGRTQQDIAGWLSAALRDGHGSDGRVLAAAMPRYAMSGRDLDALAAYVAALPYADRPGLDAQTLAISVDFSGSGFAPEAQQALLALLQEDAAALNREGGIFGRRFSIVGDDDAAFFGLGWVADPERRVAHLAVRAPPPSAVPACVGCCLSLHPDLEAQVAWLSGYLREQGLRPDYYGPLAASLAPDADIADAGRTSVPVLLGTAGALRRGRAQTTYVFGDLDAFSVADTAGLIQVTAIDLPGQLRAVRQLQSTHPRLASPRVASAGVELRRAFALAARALEANGRRVGVRATCDYLATLVPMEQGFSLVRLSDGEVVATSAKTPSKR